MKSRTEIEVFCFPVGTDFNRAGLDDAKDWERIQIFQYSRVLQIEEDDLRRWYDMVETTEPFLPHILLTKFESR